MRSHFSALLLSSFLQAWGIQNVKQALTPQRWSALLGACDQGVQQGLFSPTDAALLLGNLCSLSKVRTRGESRLMFAAMPHTFQRQPHFATTLTISLLSFTRGRSKPVCLTSGWWVLQTRLSCSTTSGQLTLLTG